MSIVTPLNREPHFIVPGLHTECERPPSRYDGTLLIVLLVSAFMAGLMIIGGIDVATSFWAWVS